MCFCNWWSFCKSLTFRSYRNDISYIEDHVDSLNGCEFLRFLVVVAFHILTCFAWFKRKRNHVGILLSLEKKEQDSLKEGDEIVVVQIKDTSIPIYDKDGLIIGYASNNTSTHSPCDVVEDSSLVSNIRCDSENLLNLENRTAHYKQLDHEKSEHISLLDWSSLSFVGSNILFTGLVVSRMEKNFRTCFCFLCNRRQSDESPKESKIRNKIAESISSKNEPLIVEEIQ